MLFIYLEGDGFEERKVCISPPAGGRITQTAGRPASPKINEAKRKSGISNS